MNSLLFIILLSAGAGPPEFEVRPLDGPPLSGRLVELDAARVTVEGAAGRASLATERVASLAARQRPAASAPAAWIELTDGSLVAARQYTARQGQARIVTADGTDLELPTREVAWVCLQAAPGGPSGQWARIAGLKLQTDLLVTGGGDNLDYHKGTIHDVTEQQVRFELDGQVLGVKRSKVHGLVYYHASDGAPPAAPIVILDAAGSRWAARSVSLAAAAGDTLEWTAPGGRTLRRSLEQIVRIDLSRGKIVYLSDLRPDSAVYTPLFGMEKELPARLELNRPRQDQNLRAKPLRIAGTEFGKGLALHSRTEMAYTVPDGFRRFEALAGIDDDVRPRGRVRLVIRGDDKRLLEATLAGTDKAPQPIGLDIAGCRRLVIIADFGGDLDLAGDLDLGNARLVK